MKHLMTLGAALSKGDDFGMTPLWAAKKEGHQEIYDILLAAGAELSAA